MHQYANSMILAAVPAICLALIASPVIAGSDRDGVAVVDMGSGEFECTNPGP